jgi:6-phosphogluconolactonase (cycloisomerase 2 family)
MKTTARLASAGGIAMAASALFAGPLLAGPLLASPALATTAQPAHHRSAAVFAQTDNPGGNTIVSYDRAANGTLHQAGTYPTGGAGGVLTGSVVDHTASQGSLAYDQRRGLLYAVNAGSNTITVFAVDGDHLFRREVIGSGGTFPVSIAVHGNLVYVLNARDGGSVQGFRRFGDGLLRIPAWHRSLGLDPTLAPEFTHTPGQVAFTPDGSKLIVTTKANGNNVDVYQVGFFGGLSATPTVTNLPNAVPFAVAFDAGGHLAIAEAGPNALATFTVNAAGTLTAISDSLTGQAATCWIAGTGVNLYASNAGSATLSGYSDTGSGALTALGTTSTDPGTVDAAASADGRFLYAQTGANGIVDEFSINPNGSLTSIGSVTVPGGAGGEGIAAS